jgi:hypothetical protein
MGLLSAALLAFCEMYCESFVIDRCTSGLHNPEAAVRRMSGGGGGAAGRRGGLCIIKGQLISIMEGLFKPGYSYFILKFA